MKALTLRPPLGSLIVAGLKRCETRSWPTKHRGPIAIHQGCRWIEVEAQYRLAAAAEVEQLGELHRLVCTAAVGAIIGVVDVVECLPAESVRNEIAGLELAAGDFSIGRFVWRLANPVVWPRPLPCRGRLGLFDVHVSPTAGQIS